MLTLKLFDILVLPVLTYGIEVWGPLLIANENLSKVQNHTLKVMLEPTIIEKLNLHLCKYVLGVSRKATNDAVRGEIGRLPIIILALKRCLSYAKRCYNLPYTYLVRKTLPTSINCLYPQWITHVCSLHQLPDTDQDVSTSDYIPQILSKYSSAYIQGQCIARYKLGWLDSINKKYNPAANNKLSTYASFKKVFEAENYVLGISRPQRRYFTKLRISSHHLAIETGRYTRPVTPRERRLCNSCCLGEIGDEKHFLLRCPKFDRERASMFDELSEFLIIQNSQDFKTFDTLMQCLAGDLEVGRVVCSYVEKCFSAV